MYDGVCFLACFELWSFMKYSVDFPEEATVAPPSDNV